MLVADSRLQIPHEVQRAPLPRRRARELLRHSSFQPRLGIGDHQVHARKASAAQADEELTPEVEGLAVTRRGAEDLAGTVSEDTDGHHQRLRD